MEIMNNKQGWKRFLMVVALMIIATSLWYTNRLVNKMAQDERKNVSIWAATIQERAELVKTTENFFEELRTEERKKVQLLAEATRRLVTAQNSDDIAFFSEIISDNKTIPVVLTDSRSRIISSNNVSFNKDSVKYLRGELKKAFTKYPPILFDYFSGELSSQPHSQRVHYYYYKDSKVFTELKQYLDDLVNSFFSEVVINSASVPVIITDSSRHQLIASGNIHEGNLTDSLFLQKTLQQMEAENKPIRLDFVDYGTSYIFYRDSYLLRQFRYYPYVQITIIAFFIFLSYMLFNASRRSEQNQVWAGMAKETAHQLGTPLSSLMAWTEMLKMQNIDNHIINEIEKDISRLDDVTRRFSKIGSAVTLKDTNVVTAIYEAVDYLKNRTSQKVSYQINIPKDYMVPLPLNKHLFQWVIENLVKNAVDAIEGEGKIQIGVFEENKVVYVDISDDGKGMTRKQIQHIFHPGFTTKKRGWGLGLTLVKRILEQYHGGKIFVKNSAPGKGTTFRIVLKKHPKPVKKGLFRYHQ
jgi:signal transduction histidine kinase